MLKSISASMSSRFRQVSSRKIVIVSSLFCHYSILFNDVVIVFLTCILAVPFISLEFHLYKVW